MPFVNESDLVALSQAAIVAIANMKASGGDLSEIMIIETVEVVIKSNNNAILDRMYQWLITLEHDFDEKEDLLDFLSEAGKPTIFRIGHEDRSLQAYV